MQKPKLNKSLFACYDLKLTDEVRGLYFERHFTEICRVCMRGMYVELSERSQNKIHLGQALGVVRFEYDLED